MGPSCLVAGSGRLDGETTLVMDSSVVTCYWEEGPEVLLTDYSDTYTYGNGVVSDGWGNEWVSSKDKPAKTIRPTLMPKLRKPEFNADRFLSSVMSDPRLDGANCHYLRLLWEPARCRELPPGNRGVPVHNLGLRRTERALDWRGDERDRRGWPRLVARVASGQRGTSRSRTWTSSLKAGAPHRRST